MTLAPVWRTRLVAVAAGIAAVWLGSSVAQQQLTLAALCIAVCGAAIVMSMSALPVATLLLGGAMFGYIVGNRGFAQLSLASKVPLLPAEFVLLVAGAMLAAQSALRRTIPVRRDALDILVLLWIVASSVRLYSDLRHHGAVALRDYAMVYYGAFFFIAQHAAATEQGRNFLHGCLLWACGTVLVAYPLFVQFPEFFLGALTIGGTPIVFFKGDLAGTFMAVGAVLFYARYEERGARAVLACSLLLAGSAITTNNRASMVGLIAATVLLALARRWRFAAWQGAAGIVAALVVLGLAYVRNEPWENTRVYGAYERVLSLADPQGKRVYVAEDAAFKGDNNLFRTVWWRLVYEETVSISPIVGLGFGHDLAVRFVREYYPDMDEFTTRSPHNIAVTLFARTGLVGLVPFVAIAALLAWRGVKAARRDVTNGALWGAVAVILVSALFGVVLEGPMGAVVFWSVLGMANAGYAELNAAAHQSEPASNEHLPAEPSKRELSPP